MVGVSPLPPRASTSCLAPIQQFARASGFPLLVARRLGCARHQSSIANYWLWSVSHRWCSEMGHSVSNSSVFQGCCLSSQALELLKLSVSSIKAHHYILSAVFVFKLPELGVHHVLWDLIRSFCPQLPSSWDWDVILSHLLSSAYEPLEGFSLQALIRMTVLGCSHRCLESCGAPGPL